VKIMTGTFDFIFASRRRDAVVAGIRECMSSSEPRAVMTGVHFLSFDPRTRTVYVSKAVFDADEAAKAAPVCVPYADMESILDGEAADIGDTD
jgi:hypothetical protein